MEDRSLFESWFSSKKLEEYTTEVGANLIGMVKKIQMYSARRPLIILQRIDQGVLTLC